MGTTERLKDLIDRQKEGIIQLEAECRAIENSDMARENVELKAKLEKLYIDYEKANSNASALSKENAGLKNALYEQIYNEKIKILNITAKKLDVYFKSNVDGEQNRLTIFENGVRSRINNFTAALRQYNIDTKDEIYTKIDELTTLLNERVTIARTKAAHTQAAFSEDERAEFEALRREQITDEQIRAIAKKNNFERFVGLNLLNAIGIFLIIIGVITAARYAYVQLPNTLRGIMMFMAGGAMLIAGELMNRKKTNIFSLGITAGGVGVLYVALATSYFGLSILDMYPAIAVCILITVAAFVLSNRYHSQVILAFALIGGYLPVFSIDGNSIFIFGAMVYFIALNLLALTISFHKKWSVSAFIGLFLNIIGTLVICLHFSYAAALKSKLLVILYVLFAFLIYTLIPIVSTYRTKTKFRKSDVVLLAINTFFSSLFMYGVFDMLQLNNFNGVIAIVFAVTYLFLGRFIEKKFTVEERNTKALFYLTGLAFVVLIIPLQFGRTWLSLGWLAEGVLLTTYGILNNENIFKRIGLIISGLCLSAFILFDCSWTYHYLFAYKYFAITLGSLIILGMYMYKKMMAGWFVKIYKYFALANVWFYTLYIIGKLGTMLFENYSGRLYNIGYLIAATAIVSTFLIAYTIPRIKILSDLGTKIMSIVLYVIGILWLLVINSMSSPIHNSLSAPFGIMLIGTLVLIIVGLISVLAVRDLMGFIVTGRKLGVEWYPLIISGYFILILTQNLITQYDLSFSSAVISIIYVLTAFAWIVYGFVKRYSFIRRFGLGLAILAVIKLFIIDLFSLTQGFRIVSYFALGITLLAISFVYQYFSKRLERMEEVPVDVEENH
ncbi:DUF2339 domain-containing protein [Clostridium sp. WB02_MRS01]|uniref:DUF2339 domain-containing protein n=1 Tax=Clostridium sp. WB02_MRS01 TaxID=2605777 RepID=UPI0012B1DF17|nr:DUF2339 domain-containing protein [Clostridium sp. WB02_MRS01]MSS07288.1 DUF2339 domain-containing protein [Clostridium sp. WB02_MRS01]